MGGYRSDHGTMSTLRFTRGRARLLSVLLVPRSISPQTLDGGRHRTARLRRISCPSHLSCFALIGKECHSHEEISRSNQSKKGAPLPGRLLVKNSRSSRCHSLEAEELFRSIQIDLHVRHHGHVGAAGQTFGIELVHHVETVELRGKGEVRLGSIDKILVENLEAATGQEARFVALGHLLRGGTPSTLGRILATRFGVGAVLLLAEGRFGHMVSYLDYHVGGAPIAKAVSRLRTEAPDPATVASARSVGICFGD